MQPKVIFSVIPVNLESQLIHYFLKSDWAKIIIKAHPGLDGAKNLLAVKTYVKEIRRKNPALLKDLAGKFQKIWNENGHDILDALQQKIGSAWPNRNIKAYVSINPVCPRFINSWSFSIDFNINKPATIRRVVAHEVSHFLHFKKLTEIKPEINPKHFEAPHPEWLLSELAAVLVLNDQHVQRFIKEKDKPYPEHARLKLHGKNLFKVIKQIYAKSMLTKRGYARFLEQADQAVNQNG